MRQPEPRTAADDPWQATDPALAIAQQERDWYGRARDRARLAYRISEITLLLCTAGTTVAAGLRASSWLTASLAGISLVLIGLRRLFDWNEEWIAKTAVWSALRVAVDDYQLIPEAERDAACRRRLLDRVHEVVGTETGSWASRRREAVRQAP